MTTSDARKRNAEQGPVLHDLEDVAEELGVDLSEPEDVTEEPHKVHDHGIDPTCRERVGSDGLLRGECVDPAPADVDPDEALARVLCEVMADDWTATDLAHAAREHLMGELHDRAEEVERRLMSATRRADHAEAAMRAEVKDHDATRARAEKTEAERDEWRERYVELSERMDEAAQDFRITAAERDEWKCRHAALRADVEAVRRNPGTLTRLLMRIADALDRDDERAES